MLVLFMHFVQQFFVLSRNVSLAPLGLGTFCDDKIIGWARRELVHHTHTAILCCHAKLLSVA